MNFVHPAPPPFLEGQLACKLIYQHLHTPYPIPSVVLYMALLTYSGYLFSKSNFQSVYNSGETAGTLQEGGAGPLEWHIWESPLWIM